MSCRPNLRSLTTPSTAAEPAARASPSGQACASGLAQPCRQVLRLRHTSSFVKQAVYMLSEWVYGASGPGPHICCTGRCVILDLLAHRHKFRTFTPAI
jgi:hypothetical protein